MIEFKAAVYARTFYCSIPLDNNRSDLKIQHHRKYIMIRERHSLDTGARENTRGYPFITAYFIKAPLTFHKEQYRSESLNFVYSIFPDTHTRFVADHVAYRYEYDTTWTLAQDRTQGSIPSLQRILSKPPLTNNSPEARILSSIPAATVSHTHMLCRGSCHVQVRLEQDPDPW